MSIICCKDCSKCTDTSWKISKKYLHISCWSVIITTLQYPSFARANTVSEFSYVRSLYVFGHFFVLLHLSIDAHYQIPRRGFPGNTSTKYDGHAVIVSKSTHYEFLQILVGAFFIIDRSLKGSPNLLSGEPYGPPCI